MTSSELKKCLWIFCPQRTLHDIPKIPQIGVKSGFAFPGNEFVDPSSLVVVRLRCFMTGQGKL